MAITPDVLKPGITNELVELCRQSLRRQIIDPSVEIRDITVETLESPRFDTVSPRLCYIVTVHTNDATMVRGAVEAYKGSYKERLESILDSAVKQQNGQAFVHVQIAGPQIQTVDRLIPIKSFLETKRLSSASPVVRAARKNEIDYIQIRGRHLIAPSPAIADFLEQYGSEHSTEIRNVADFFAGTGIATKVLLRVADPERVTLIENDPQKIRKICKHVNDKRVEILQADALHFSFMKSYDLAVADPYYEDVHAFLAAQLQNVQRFVRIFLLVPGNVEDILWNDQVLSRLQHAGFDVSVHEIYGQVIFEAKNQSKVQGTGGPGLK